MERGISGFLATVLVACSLFYSAAAQGAAAGLPDIAENEPLVILFEKNQKNLTAADRTMIQRLIAARKPSSEKMILVLGYSDGRGNPKKNLEISQQRAEAVRAEILRVSGAAPQHVLAFGRGAQGPIGDNRRANGRARNRRVEIYWAQAVDAAGKIIKERPLVSPAVAGIVQTARSLIRRRALNEAVQELDRVRGQGGEYDSNWQAVYGIAGFYAGMEVQLVKQYLSRALELDAFNQEARDYLGRIVAREKVLDGTVNAHMGLTEQDPLSVSSDGQIHEYLRLFGAVPISKYKAISKPLEAWHCRDRQGRPRVYYFDRSQVYTWAFADNRPGAVRPADATVARTTR